MSKKKKKLACGKICVKRREKPVYPSETLAEHYKNLFKLGYSEEEEEE